MNNILKFVFTVDRKTNQRSGFIGSGGGGDVRTPKRRRVPPGQSAAEDDHRQRGGRLSPGNVEVGRHCIGERLEGWRSLN